MPAATTDKIQKVAASTVTTLASPGKALAATSLTVGSTTNYPTDTGITIAIRIVDSNGALVAGTYTEWLATVSSGTTLAIDPTPVYGADQVYPAGSTTQVYIPISSYWMNLIATALLTIMDQDGTLKAGAVDNADVLASDVVTTAKILNANVTTAKIADANVTNAKLATGAGEPGGAWDSWTPTVTASSGTITTASATGSYKKIGKTIVFRSTVTITTNGTGAGSVRITLPENSSVSTVGVTIGSGREGNVAGKALTMDLGSASIVNIRNYDNTYPGSNGAVMYVNGTYEAA